MPAHGITISAGPVRVQAELGDTPTARAVLAALPIDAVASTWGDEVYFEIPVSVEAEPDARPEVEVGDLAYWPPGRALCIFFGPTPASDASAAPRAASEVNLLGRITGDVALFREVRDGDPIRVEAES